MLLRIFFTAFANHWFHQFAGYTRPYGVPRMRWLDDMHQNLRFCEGFVTVKVLLQWFHPWYANVVPFPLIGRSNSFT